LPSDANGVYSLPTGYLAVTGEVIQASQHNPPLEDLASAMTQRLMRSGAAPMTGALKIVDGSVGSPAVQFANASSTGLYKTTNGIGVSINGTKVAEFTSDGIIKSARFIGEIFDWTGTTAPALCVLPYGQTLSRTDYADLWAFAQTEIAAGNTFYNNGNGTTTFGIGDLRGRVVAGKDDMGGNSAFRLTATGLGVAGDVIGSAGASETYTLVNSNFPPYTPSGTIAGTSVIAWALDQAQAPGGSARNLVATIGPVANLGNSANLTLNGTFTGSAQGGTSTPFSRCQPTIVLNRALFAGA
jgi:microcystin-dependent protein